VVALTVSIIQLVLMILTIIRLWIDGRKKKSKKEEILPEQLMEFAPTLYFPPPMSYTEYPIAYQQIPLYDYPEHPFERPMPSAPKPYELV